jgi:hypothetical protein
MDKVDEVLDQRTSTAGSTNPESNTMKGGDTVKDLAAVLEQRRAMIDAEAQVRVQMAYAKVFRDACGRVVARKPADREKAVPTVFEMLLSGLAVGLDVEVNDEFTSDYLGSMSKRAKDWNDVNVVAGEELRRAVTAILERGEA